MHLEVVEVVVVQFNLAGNQYQQYYIFSPPVNLMLIC